MIELLQSVRLTAQLLHKGGNEWGGGCWIESRVLSLLRTKEDLPLFSLPSLTLRLVPIASLKGDLSQVSREQTDYQTTQQATISEYLLHSGVFEFSKEEVSMLLVPTLSPKGTDRAKIGARCVSQPGGPAPALELNFLSRETFLYISPAN